MMKRWHKLLSLTLSLVLAASLAACGGRSGGTKLVVFAAASMQETLTEIGEAYMKEHPDITLTFSFDSSGTLKTQIEEGAVCDAFISAGQSQMDGLEAGGYILSGSRFDLLENKVALAVPEGNLARVMSYGDLRERLEAGGGILLAMGHSAVPGGQYSL